MKVKILFDKEALDQRFAAGWGVSYLVGEEVLFDAGEKFEHLEKNAHVMGARLDRIKHVVISHDHWDHTGGLWEILRLNPQAAVYVCVNADPEFRARVAAASPRLVDVKDRCRITGAIYSSGECRVSYKGKVVAEQSLVVERDQAVSILCGCCHPGLVNIIEKVRHTTSKSVDCVIGGMHMMEIDKRFIAYIAAEAIKNVKRIGPAHCSGQEAARIFQEVYGKNFIEVKAGMEIEI